MLDPWDSGDDSGTVFRDVLLRAVAGVVFNTMRPQPYINPRTKQGEGSTDPPGNVIAEMRWDDKLRTDVDLWVQAPGDVPVGYSNKSGLIFNLLRDDLGQQLDLSGLNYESSYSRGIVPGEYTVNLHLYRNRTGLPEVPVTVIVSTKPTSADPARQVLMSKVELAREGQERTVFRFRLTERGDLVSGSVTSLPRPLRSGTKS